MLELRKSKKLIDAYVQTCEYAEKRDKTPDRQAVVFFCGR